MRSQRIGSRSRVGTLGLSNESGRSLLGSSGVLADPRAAGLRSTHGARRCIQLCVGLLLACSPSTVTPRTSDAGPTGVADASAEDTAPTIPTPCSPSDGRDPRVTCADEIPSCEGDVGRILELRIPAPPGFSRTFLGYPLDATFSPIPGATSLFEDAALVEIVTDETRAEIHDFESERGRDAHARGCVSGGSLVPGTSACIGFESGSTSAYDYRAVHLVSSRRFVHVDDLAGRIDPSRVPPEALWYYHGVELGHSVDLRTWTREMSRVRGFDVSLGLPTFGGSGTPCMGSECTESPGRHVFGETETFTIGAGFRDFAAREGYELSAVLRGFRLLDAGACFQSSDGDSLGGCFRPSDEPSLLYVTIRNVPTRCVPPDRRVDRPRPFETEVELISLEIEEPFGEEPEWALRPVCEVEPGVSLGTPFAPIVLAGVRRGLYDLPGTSTRGGMLGGRTLRCAIVGEVAGRVTARDNVPFASAWIEIPTDVDSAEIPFEIAASSAYRARGVVRVRRETSE